MINVNLQNFVGKTISELTDAIYPNPFINLRISNPLGKRFTLEESTDLIIYQIHSSTESGYSDETETTISVLTAQNGIEGLIACYNQRYNDACTRHYQEMQEKNKEYRELSELALQYYDAYRYGNEIKKDKDEISLDRERLRGCKVTVYDFSKKED